MSTINISLPDDLKARAEAQAARAGHRSVEDYLCALLREDLEREMGPELEAELLKGLDSPAEEMMDNDWDNIRRDLLSRHGRTDTR